MNKGTLFVLSGPSGAGKGTVLKRVMAKRDDVFLSVSATTRAPRAEDTEGVTYYFVTKDQFEQMIAQNEVLEYAQYCGNYYGTPLKAVKNKLAEGKNVVLEIEVVGAAKVKQLMPKAVLVFIVPPSMQVLSKRLHDRGTETEEVIHDRLETAKKEVGQMDHYDYIVINDVLDDAVSELDAIIESQKCIREKRINEIKGAY